MAPAGSHSMSAGCSYSEVCWARENTNTAASSTAAMPFLCNQSDTTTVGAGSCRARQRTRCHSSQLKQLPLCSVAVTRARRRRKTTDHRANRLGSQVKHTDRVHGQHRHTHSHSCGWQPGVTTLCDVSAPPGPASGMTGPMSRGKAQRSSNNYKF